MHRLRAPSSGTLRRLGHSLRTLGAVMAARVTVEAVQRAGRGGGTSLPGLVAARVQPDVVRTLAARLEAGSAVVTGTNGKTTTSRMLADILRVAGFDLVLNPSGSNLTRGIASALLRDADPFRRSTRSRKRFGLFEVDEAALPEVARMLAPARLVLNNLFRDQLDRYGEVATVARLWSIALDQLPPSSKLIANADDPLVSDVAVRSGHDVHYFGIASFQGEGVGAEHASDVKSCPHCGGAVEYAMVTLGHLGHYRCTVCSFNRPQPSVSADDVTLLGIGGSQFTLTSGSETAPCRLQVPGLYNVYNALAAATTALSLGVPMPVVTQALEGTSAAFGRMERIQVNGKSVYLALAKNPAGLNEVMRTVIQSPEPVHLLVSLNDNSADGRDVSWIWDADVEMLAGRVAALTFSGTRAGDIALRFKYAGVTGGSGTGYSIENSPSSGLETALHQVPAGGVLFAIPTYTAMLDLRDVLTRGGYVKPYWEV